MGIPGQNSVAVPGPSVGQATLSELPAQATPVSLLAEYEELNPPDPVFLKTLKNNPVRIKVLVGERQLEKGNWVQTSQSKHGGFLWWKNRKRGEWGEIKELPTEANKHRVKVHWKKYEDWTNCKIMAYSKSKDKASLRRRMAVREHSSRRDSPVMLRLLEKIVAAQD